MAKKTVETPDEFEDIRVYRTKRYNKFHFLEQNRKVSKEHVAKLAGKIKEKGFNKNYSIKVIEKDGQYYITSGQHRFKGAQEADAEFYYSIIPPDEKETSFLQEHLGSQKDWNLDAVLNFYVHHDKRNKHYKMFDGFVKNFDFPTGIALVLAIGLDIETGKPLQKAYMNEFKEGHFKISKSRVTAAEVCADRITKIIDSDESYRKFAKNSAFVKAMYLLINHENFTPKRLEQALRTSPRGFVVQGKWAETLQAVTDLYNGTLRNKKIDFPKIFAPLEKARRKNRFS